MAGTRVWAQHKVPIKVMNVTNQDQAPTRGTTLGCYEPHVGGTTCEMEPQTQ
jgi:hypothetical protein